jgi:hypothetical protein
VDSPSRRRPADARGRGVDREGAQLDELRRRPGRCRRRARGRCSAEAIALGGDLVPHAGLVGARRHPGGRALAGHGVLGAALGGIGRLRRGGEGLVVTLAVPAARLDARDRDLLRAAGTNTLTSNVRFCCAPRTSSPSNSSTGVAVGFMMMRSLTDAPVGSSPIVTPAAQA